MFAITSMLAAATLLLQIPGNPNPPDELQCLLVAGGYPTGVDSFHVGDRGLLAVGVPAPSRADSVVVEISQDRHGPWQLLDPYSAIASDSWDNPMIGPMVDCSDMEIFRCGVAVRVRYDGPTGTYFVRATWHRPGGRDVAYAKLTILP
jgi:hypothetical protein